MSAPASRRGFLAAGTAALALPAAGAATAHVPALTWPHADTALVNASCELAMLELGLNGLHDSIGEGADEDPRYIAIEARRWEVLAILATTPAVTMDGLEAKAEALTSRQVSEDYQSTGEIAASLAADILAFVAKGRT